eukprot:TRINITY_DN11830_c0_g2_i1.p1 TRINITY_DN11830_c0_g2~~TRINITY_DN11830_c0_g2_i1.p1  ORF type:complete len:501 (+),score=87.34 TRINITY_DN11830_c0_g2_i1:53-1504(+)
MAAVVSMAPAVPGHWPTNTHLRSYVRHAQSYQASTTAGSLNFASSTAAAAPLASGGGSTSLLPGGGGLKAASPSSLGSHNAFPVPVAPLGGSWGQVKPSGRIEATNGRPALTSFPDVAATWTPFERDLFQLSHGKYDATQLAQRRRIAMTQGNHAGTGCHLEVKGRVSFVTPTMSSRQRYHEQLWANFEAQDWPDKELVVVEGYITEPSSYLRQKAKDDARLLHVCFQVASDDDDFSVGLKRNMTTHLASGQYIINFDDDDIYAPCYATKIVGEMRQRGLIGLTLSAWYNYYASTGLIGFTDPEVAWEEPLAEMDEDEVEEVLYGYGFSYAYLRYAALAFPYPDVEFAEDAPFFIQLKDAFGEQKVALKKDYEGICVHIVHRANSSGDVAVARRISRSEVPRLACAALLQPVLDRFDAETLLQSAQRSVIAKFDLAVESFRGLWESTPKVNVPMLEVGGQCGVSKHRRVKSGPAEAGKHGFAA